MKRRTVTVTYCARECATVPMIRLRGGWLEAAGFAEGQVVSVVVAAGQLVLTAAPSSGRQEVVPHTVKRAAFAGGRRRVR